MDWFSRRCADLSLGLVRLSPRHEGQAGLAQSEQRPARRAPTKLRRNTLMPKQQTDDLKQLIGLLDDTSATSEPTFDEVNAVRWHTIDPIIDRAANDAWNRLKHFTFDADIRARDMQYDDQMRSEFKWRSDELRDLLDGKDPYGRRDSRLKRFLKFVGLKA